MPWPAIIAGGASLAGGLLGNRASRQESRRNRRFQERMSNTSWQRGVADMEAAGINPALAYSQGGASSPGGSLATQEDVISPSVSSAMQAKRLTAELKNIEASARKTRYEADNAANNERISRFRANFLLNDPRKAVSEEQWGARLIRSEVLAQEAQARQAGLLGDVTQPMATLSNKLGPWLPIILGAGGVGTSIFRGARLPFRKR